MSIAVDQSLLHKFISIFSSFSIDVAAENANYTPVEGTAYAEVRLLPNPEQSYSAETSRATGMFRITLNYPLHAGAVEAKIKAEEIMTAYSALGCMTYDGARVTIVDVHRQGGFVLDGWYKMTISINYSAFISRR